MTITIEKICRYPIKGLSAQSLDRVDLAADKGLPGDRVFALALPTTHFDPDAPHWLAKTNFLMLMRHERLAELETHVDENDQSLSIRRNGELVVKARIGDEDGRTAIENFFATFFDGKITGTPNLLTAPGDHMFSDHMDRVLSVINLATVREIGRVAGKTVDPLRFRANLYIDGVPPWSEFDWIDCSVGIGTARLTVTERIDRCAATTVKPGSGIRDINIPKILQQRFGHINCGVFARVVTGGSIAVGDALQINSPQES